MSETLMSGPFKAGDLGKVIDELGYLKDAVLGADFMGILGHAKSISDEFWLALHPMAPVPGNVIEARFHLAKSVEPCICASKEDLAAKIEEARLLAQAGDGEWLALFAKLLPIILTLLAG
jgi:hypothetical protein